jgi:hypothetical protein
VSDEATDAPEVEPLPQRFVAIAYVLALVCALLPLAVLGAGFAGATLFTRGKRRDGAAVIVLAVLCSILGVVLR